MPYNAPQKQSAQTQYLLVKELPTPLQRVLKEVGYGRRDIAVSGATTYTVGAGSGSGTRSFTAAVNLDTGKYNVVWGSWGGSNMFTPGNPVDNDQESRTLPSNGAVVQGAEGGGRPVYATIKVHPSSLTQLLPSGSGPDLSPQEIKALHIIGGIKSGYRKNEFDREGLGVYGPTNPLIKALADKKLVKVSPVGIQLTLEGKNMRVQVGRYAKEAAELKKVWVVRDPSKISEWVDIFFVSSMDDLVAIAIGTGASRWERENTKVYSDEASAKKDALARLKKLYKGGIPAEVGAPKTAALDIEAQWGGYLTAPVTAAGQNPHIPNNIVLDLQEATADAHAAVKTLLSIMYKADKLVMQLEGEYEDGKKDFLKGGLGNASDFDQTEGEDLLNAIRVLEDLSIVTQNQPTAPINVARKLLSILQNDLNQIKQGKWGR